MQSRKALGKGLASLIPSGPIEKATDNTAGQPILVDIDSIVPNRLQPRTDFKKEGLDELAESIRENGVIQPLIVTPEISGRYELIAGERRLRASKIAGIEKVPVIIREADPETMLELAIVENVQREDLNPIEEAHAYKELINEFDYTQDEVAKKVAKSRPYVANSLRLLLLPKVVQEDVIVGRLSTGHARALLAVSNLQEQLRLREKILHSKVTVRDVEKMVQESLGQKSSRDKAKNKKPELSPQMMALLEDMTQELGTKIKFIPYKNNKGGKIVIEYYSAQDLSRIHNKIVTRIS